MLIFIVLSGFWMLFTCFVEVKTCSFLLKTVFLFRFLTSNMVANKKFEILLFFSVVLLEGKLFLEKWDCYHLYFLSFKLLKITLWPEFHWWVQFVENSKGNNSEPPWAREQILLSSEMLPKESLQIFVYLVWNDL